MLRAAAKAAAENPSSPRLLAVTVLTSMDAAQMKGVGLNDTPAQQVLRLARLAGECGMEGLVCSSEETATLRHELGRKPFLVVPGIRPTGSEAGDQKRIATPAEAIARGASMLVVGRPITQSKHPGDAARSILAEIARK
jgi:orotidine-5'-phosphate decarboxylase